ncbi:GNAT family N-acetyltransferase [Jiulongibacter sp. NS-SX5]|uniref:GNAT family N-acetyltransferase n=1 Tax=Jiulongibacter sp. NS-SX5 TaxID=3463854 RepID=UPI004058439E
MLDGFEFKVITNEDLPTLRQIYKESRQGELDLLTTWTDGQIDEFVDHQFLAQHKYYIENYKGSKFWLIRKEGGPIGRLYLKEYENEFRIIDIALLIAWRRKGIGKRILEKILSSAAEKGKAVSIHVEKNNPALDLYKSLGFQEKEDKGVYWFMVKD